jgi:hypothetical protein
MSMFETQFYLTNRHRLKLVFIYQLDAQFSYSVIYVLN